MSEQYVIGEGVILDTRPASFLSRGLGSLLDAVIYVSLCFTTLIVLSSTGNFPAGYEAQVIICSLVFFLVVLPTTVEALWRGRSVGKLAAGLCVVRDDGGPIGLRHAFIRAMVGVLELYFTAGAFAVVTALTNDRGKRLGDLLAGTYAIRVRSKKAHNIELLVPAPLVAWVSTAEISKFPDGLGLSARQFLERRFQMTPHSRAMMAESYAQKLALHVAPSPPFPVPAEEYITAVVAERSRREAVLETQRLERAHIVQARMNSLPYGVRSGS